MHGLLYLLSKNKGALTQSMHEKGFIDLVHILMDSVHRPGPRKGSMDQGSTFGTLPRQINAGGSPTMD